MWNFKNRCCDLEKQFAIQNVETGIYFKLELLKAQAQDQKFKLNRTCLYQ